MICGLWKADKGERGGLVLTQAQTENALRNSILGKVYKQGRLAAHRPRA